MNSDTYTVFYDDGRKPHFEKFDTRDEAEAYKSYLIYERGQSAIIMEDEDE